MSEQVLQLARRKMKTEISSLRATRAEGFEILIFTCMDNRLMWFQQELSNFMIQNSGIKPEWILVDRSNGQFITHEEFYARIIKRLPSVRWELRQTTLYFQG